MMHKSLVMMRPVFLLAVFLAVLQPLSVPSAFGNIPYTITEGTREFVYNQNQRIIRVVDNGVTKGEYTYDGKGRRVKKLVNGVATIFHYDQNDQLIAESGSTGNITAEYAYLNGQPLAKIEGAITYHYHNDHLGTPQKMTDAAGTVVWAADYTPFGEATITISTITNNLRGIGQYYDQETGLLYNRFRYLNPQTGRYLEADPIGQRGDIDPYVYVHDNPINWTDPLGLETYQCTKPLDALTDKFGSDASNFAYQYLPYAYHQYSCVVRDKKTTCGGQDHAGSPVRSPGKPSNDVKTDQCKKTQPDNDCFENCLKAEWAKPRPTYGIPFGTDCQEYDNDVNNRCLQQCKK